MSTETVHSQQSGLIMGGQRPGLARQHKIAAIVLVALAITSPFVLPPIFLAKVLAFAVFAIGLNLLAGYGGMISFGHAAFFGFGGYMAAWSAKHWEFTPEAAVLLAGFSGLVLGASFGWVATRRRELYFSMITLALGQMVYFFCLQAEFTGGEDGIQRVPRGAVLGVLPLDQDLAVYAFVLALFAVVFVISARVMYSPFGEILRAIRDNEPRAISLGYDPNKYRILVFTISAVMGGMAGGAKAIVFGLASLSDVHFAMSGLIVLVVLLGGIGTIYGPVVGALIVVAVESYFAQLGAWFTVSQGAIFVLCVLVFRKGLIGAINERWRLNL